MTSHLNKTMFLDSPIEVDRYDVVKYPQIEKLTERQMGYFWRPQEVVLTKDSRDFKGLTEFEQHIFVSNLKRQILLDSKQGRDPAVVLGPIASLPEIEAFIITWTFFEKIHSRSYSHILRNVYPDPSMVFDEMMQIPEIMACSKDISHYYDILDKYNRSMNAEIKNPLGHKRALWMCLNSINALEGIRFYVSFACSWAFAELNKMEGNAKIIKLIARDENIHLAFTQQVLKLLPKEDPDFARIKEECAGDVKDMFEAVIEQEKAWAEYLFKGGSIIGLNEELLKRYVDWIAHKRMTSIGVESDPARGGSNPLPWTAKWISGANVQVAPQETEITSYIIGGIKQDMEISDLKGLSL